MRKRYLSLLLLLLYVMVSAGHTAQTVESHWYFGLPAYSTYIHFSAQQTLSWSNRSNNFWYFNTFGFQVINANMTIITPISSLPSAETFTFNVTGSGTSTTRIYAGAKGEPYAITGADDWNYTDGNSTIAITVNHASTEQVTVTWLTVSVPGLVETLLTSYRDRFSQVLLVVAVGVVAVAGGSILVAIRGDFRLSLENAFVFVYFAAGAIVAGIIVMYAFQVIIAALT